MSKILKVSENNYRLQVQPGGIITLDTGTSPGKVVITGDLEVRGDTTYINVSDMQVEDNIILLNKGQTGNGISSSLGYQSGIEIERGDYSNAKMVFDETVTHYNQITELSDPGTFVFRFADNTLAGIQVSGVAAGSGSDLNLDMQGEPVVAKIVNADPSSYSLRVTAGSGNAIPNKQFIYDYITSSVVVSGQADVDRIYKGHGLPVTIDTEILATTSSLIFYVGGVTGSNQRAIITSSGLSVDDINFYNHTITNTGVSNLIITSASSNEVEIDSVLDLTDQTAPVAVTPNKTKIYSQATAGPGKTGLFFKNTTTADELVAKNRALLFSMLF
jgi:hypothetical protein